MLSKKKRVTKESFHNTIKKGKILKSSLFTLYYLPQKQPQYAFVVPKTLVKQAFIRNKLRRQGYNILKQINQTPSIIGIFLYKKEAKNASLKEVNDDINALLSKTIKINL